jgi:hypothetical protein
MAIDPNRQRVRIGYVGDDGKDYFIVTSRNHAAAVNATAPVSNAKALPARWKPRHIHLTQTNAGRDRGISLIVPSRTFDAFIGTQNTVDVAPFGTLRVTGMMGEGRTQGAPNFNGTATPPNERVAINYQSDDGNVYAFVTTRAHAAAVGAVAPAADAPAYPTAWTPRHYYLLNPDLAGPDQKMRLVEPNPNAAKWLADSQQTFDVNGTTFNTTGRKDEHRTKGAPDYVP